MPFTRQPLLSPEVEAQLRKDTHPYWESGMNGRLMANKLGLEVKGSLLEDVPPHYIYFYRLKWQKLHIKDPKKYPLSFLPRKVPAFGIGEQRYKIHPDDLGVITQDQFINDLNEKLPPPPEDLHWQYAYTIKRARAYLIFHFYTPLRCAEIRERDIRDYELTDESIIIHLLRLKKHHKKGDRDEPIEIPISWRLMNEALEWIQPKHTDEKEYKKWTEENEEAIRENKRNKDNKEYIKKDEVQYNRPFGFSESTARNYVHKLYPKRFPHNFRFIYITSMISRFPKVKIDHIRAKTYLTHAAIEKYIITEKKKARELDMLLTEEYT
ncbi:hypothetical protein ES702_04124 [subsurface metagenome]